MRRLSPKDTLLVVIDVQERLASAMPPEPFARLVSNTGILLEAARVLGVPVMASEQYPKGLGATVAPIASKLAELGVTPIEKLHFDACGEPRFALALSALAPRSVVVVGMEAHVCVFQTARELVQRGYATFVVADAVTSRRDENREIGLSLCERAGAIITSTETVAFDLLERAGSDAFKAISKLVR
jgi:nicotinamidase-related amidase